MKLNHQVYLYIIPVLLSLMFFEIYHLQKGKQFNKKDLFCSIGIVLGAETIYYLVVGAIFFSYSFVYQYRFFTLSVNHWYTWVICFFADDLSYYWFHRLSHKVRFFWASHIVHHSSEVFTYSAALRVPWTGNITGSFLFWLWMPLIGIHPLVVIFMKSLSSLYQFTVHTETVKKLPRFIEAVFVTPSHHRVHHSSEIEYLDKNYGGNLIIWDRIFGTFLQEEHKPVVYGLTQNIFSYNPITVATHEWQKVFKDLKKSHSLKDRFHYLFNPPGWKPDGRSKTAKQLQTELKKNAERTAQEMRRRILESSN
jgi:sterol desaturase/sphingolipid hydroxylase (fatty acid hydroxylase superfamily)